MIGGKRKTSAFSQVGVDERRLSDFIVRLDMGDRRLKFVML